MLNAFRRRGSAEEDRNARDDRHLRMVMAFLLDADSVYVDIGAHAGDLLSRAVEVAPNAKHVAVEPIPELAQRLRERYPSVDVRQAAVSHEAGRMSFHHVPDEPATSGLQLHPAFDESRSSQITVEVHRLDDILDGPPALLKIDAEGGEYDALRGGERTILEPRVPLALEFGPNPSSAYDVTPRMMFDLLAGHGYRIFDMDGAGPYDFAGFEAAGNDPGDGRRWNWFAR